MQVAGKVVVVTGGANGIGRALCEAFHRAGAAKVIVADLDIAGAQAVAASVDGAAFKCDVGQEKDIVHVIEETERKFGPIALFCSNAGIGGGGSLFTNSREQWERTFNICWGGVYLGVRTFLPMLMKADEGHIVNTSSVNGFWASIGMGVSHTAYSSAKFAVKGFTEALINDLRLNAPHIKCSVVMPGHIGTSIVSNSRKVLSGSDSERLSENEILGARQRLKGMGIDTAGMSDEDIQKIALDRARSFRDEAPTSAAAAARIILDGVKAERWRILVGDDAERLDERVRQTPEKAYTPEFYQSFAAEVGWRLG